MKKILEEIFNICEFNLSSKEYFEAMINRDYIMGLPNNNLVIRKSNKSTFYFTIFEIQKKYDFENTLSFKEINKHLLTFLIETYNNKSPLPLDDIFFEKLKSLPIIDYRIYKSIFGIILENPNVVCSIGEYKIYFWPKTKEYIENQYNINSDTIWLDNTHKYLIEVIVQARDVEKAYSLADEKFEFFENLIHLCIGSSDSSFRISITDYKAEYLSNSYCFSEHGLNSNLHRENLLTPIPIDNDYFTSNKYLTKILGTNPTNNCSKLRIRIIKSIKWLGEAFRERSMNNGILKAVIALETIFTYQEKTIINASILSSVAESTALLLGKNSEERIGIEKRMKKIYSYRSSIAHHGKTNKNDAGIIYNDICGVVRAVIITLLLESRYDSFSIDDLFNDFKKRNILFNDMNNTKYV